MFSTYCGWKPLLHVIANGRIRMPVEITSRMLFKVIWPPYWETYKWSLRLIWLRSMRLEQAVNRDELVDIRVLGMQRAI
jgi:hypothetical protein